MIKAEHNDQTVSALISIQIARYEEETPVNICKSETSV